MIKPNNITFSAGRTLTNGLVRAWLFPDGTEYVAEEDATVIGSPTTVSTGKWGDATDFVSASSQYAHAGDTTAMDGLSEMTVCFGLLPDSMSATTAIVRKQRAGEATMNCSTVDALGNVRMVIFGDNAQQLTVDTSFAPLSAGTAVNCAMRWGGGSDLKFFANGTTGADTNNSATPDTIADSAEFLSFMARYNNNSPDQFFDGKLAYVYIYNRALSTVEIAALNTNPFVFFRPTSSTLRRGKYGIGLGPGLGLG